MPTCYRHPTRETGVSCSNCGRPICPDCMTLDAGRHALPGVLARAHARAPHARDAGDAGRDAGAHRGQRARLPRRAGDRQRLRQRRRDRLRERRAATARYVDVPDEWWRLVTAGFLHASFFHIAFNMVFIWIHRPLARAGDRQARASSSSTCASLLCGSLGVLLLEPDAVAVGASGAAFGLLGALMVEARSRGIDLWATGLLQLALLNFAITFLIPGHRDRRATSAASPAACSSERSSTRPTAAGCHGPSRWPQASRSGSSRSSAASRSPAPEAIDLERGRRRALARRRRGQVVVERNG